MRTAAAIWNYKKVHRRISIDTCFADSVGRPNVPSCCAETDIHDNRRTVLRELEKYRAKHSDAFHRSMEGKSRISGIACSISADKATYFSPVYGDHVAEHPRCIDVSCVCKTPQSCLQLVGRLTVGIFIFFSLEPLLSFSEKNILDKSRASAHTGVAIRSLKFAVFI